MLSQRSQSCFPDHSRPLSSCFHPLTRQVTGLLGASAVCISGDNAILRDVLCHAMPRVSWPRPTLTPCFCSHAPRVYPTNSWAKIFGTWSSLQGLTGKAGWTVGVTDVYEISFIYVTACCKDLEATKRSRLQNTFGLKNNDAITNIKNRNRWITKGAWWPKYSSQKRYVSLDNKVLRTIFGLLRQEGIDAWRKLRNFVTDFIICTICISQQLLLG